MLKRGVIMDCNKERAIFGKYGWRKITKCAGCPIKKDITTQWVGPVSYRSECGGVDVRDRSYYGICLRIKDEERILPICPLPLWDRVRSHASNDKPKKLKTVLIM